MAKIVQRPGGLQLDVLVLMTVIITLLAIAILPWAAQVAQMFWIVAMFVMALGAAAIEYKNRKE